MNLPLCQRDQYEKGGIGRWYWDYRDQKTLAYIQDEKVIFDAGCGEGITLEKLVRKYPQRQVMGIDCSIENVNVCKQFGLPVQIGDVYGIGYKDGSIDCCVFMEVIEHLHDPQRALGEIRRVLRKGGLLLLLFPHDRLFKAARLACFKIREAYAPSGHVKQWTPKEMRQTLEDTGFDIEEEKYLPFRFWFCSIHCLMVARKK
jgi:SAM-dependent methyltransferase